MRQVTLEDVLPTPAAALANVATNTTIGTSTLLVFGTITIQVPNLVAGGIVSAWVEVTWRDAFSVATNVSVQRVGVNINGAGFNNLDFAYTAIANTGDHEANIVTRDITSLMGAVAGPTFTLDVQFAMATAAASTFCNGRAKVYITYEFDETVVITSFAQTVTIPLQGDVTTIPTAGTYQQIGTTGTSPAPVNQIPQLTGVGGILTGYGAGLVIDRIWLEIYAQDAGGATTDFSATYRFDGAGTTYLRSLLEGNLNGSTDYIDFFDITAAGLATTVAHSFEVTTSLNARFACTCAVLKITFRFNPAALDYTRHLNSVRLPMPMANLDTYISSTVTGDRDAISADLWIEEPGTITLRQSGLFLVVASGGGATLNVATAQNNTARLYALPSLVIAGAFYVCRRADVGATPWTLARGQNTLSIGMFTTAANTAIPQGGWLYVNYESDVRTVAGTKRPWDHNHSLGFYIQNAPTTGALPTRRAITSGYQTPEIAAPWFLNGWACASIYRVGAGSFTTGIKYQVVLGEGLGVGWATRQASQINDAEVQLYWYIVSYTEDGRQNSGRNDGLNPTATRNFQFTTTVGSANSAWQWLTVHHLTFNVAVASTNFAGDGSGITVQAISNQTDRIEAEGTTAIGGGVTLTVFDNAYAHFTAAQESSTKVARSENATPTSP